MENYINEFKKMAEIRNLTDNTLKNYSGYLRVEDKRFILLNR